MRRSLEKPIENLILNYLELKNIFAFKIQRTGIWDAKKNIFRRSSNRHHICGISDILGILPDGRFLAIEVKSAKGVVSGEQRDFINKINNSKGVAFVARSLDDVIKVLEDVLPK